MVNLRRIQENSEKNLPQYLFVHDEPHVKSLGI
jgi:hypothetical protein